MRSLSCGERDILSQDGDEGDAPDIRILRKANPVARCDKACDGCEGGHIAKGETYSLTVMLAEGEFETYRTCERGRPCNAPLRPEAPRAAPAPVSSRVPYGPPSIHDDLPF